MLTIKWTYNINLFKYHMPIIFDKLFELHENNITSNAIIITQTHKILSCMSYSCHQIIHIGCNLQYISQCRIQNIYLCHFAGSDNQGNLQVLTCYTAVF